MKVALAQTRFKTADFDFNFKQITDAIEKNDCDLIIFPQYDLEDTGAKDLVIDEKSQDAVMHF